MKVGCPSPFQTSPFFILITGLPCTGKSYLANLIVRQHSLPNISKDVIKETLFNQLGWSDRRWSKKLGAVSYSLLFQFAEVLASAGNSFLIESNFDAPSHGYFFKILQDKYAFRAIQLQCVADGQVLVERFISRWESGKRHPGHVDEEAFNELRPSLLKGRLEPLPLEGLYIEVDTTDFEKVDVNSIIESLSLWIYK